MVKVKICGIRTLDEALRAVEAGADLVGFNFYPPSPRYLEPRNCARLRSDLEARSVKVLTVGVFVNAPVPEIRRILDDCGLDLAQLSGDEAAGDLQALDGRAFKGFRLRSDAVSLQEARSYARPGLAPALLVDAFRPGQYGGTGQVGDWGLARSLSLDYPLLLAGGLNPTNVSAAVAQVNPWGVDVASGVESQPGRKDPQKMSAFIRASHEASSESEYL